MQSLRAIAVLWVLSLLGGVVCRYALGSRGAATFEQAQRFAGSGQLEMAELSLRRLLAREPHRTDARLFLSQLGYARGDWATVAAVLRGVPDSDPMATDVRLAEGDAWLKLNRTRAAEDCWRRAERGASRSAQPQRRLIYLYAMQLRREPWSKAVWELYDRNEAGLREMIQLMIADHVVWETEETLEEMQRYAAADPQDLHSRRALAMYLLNAGKIAQAIAELDSIRSEQPDDYESSLALAECHLAHAELQTAAQCLDQVPNAARQNSRWWKSRGTIALQERDLDQAIADFNAALQYAPFDREVHHKIAQTLRIRGDLDKASEHAEIADRLAKIHRLCHSLYHQRTPSLADIRQLVQLCEESELIEEALGWVDVGLREDESDWFLRSAREQLGELPATSSRKPPGRSIGGREQPQ